MDSRGEKVENETAFEVCYDGARPIAGVAAVPNDFARMMSALESSARAYDGTRTARHASTNAVGHWPRVK